MPYPVAYDAGNGLAQSYGFPYGAGMIFISRAGVVTGRFRSGFTEADFIRELDRVMSNL